MKKLTTAVVLSIIAMTALPAASADRPAPASGATEARAAAQNAVEKREKAEKDAEARVRTEARNRSIAVSASLFGPGRDAATVYDMPLYNAGMLRKIKESNGSGLTVNSKYPLASGSSFSSETVMKALFRLSPGMTAGISLGLYDYLDSDDSNRPGKPIQRLSRVYGVNCPPGNFTLAAPGDPSIASRALPGALLSLENLFLSGGGERSKWKLEAGNLKPSTGKDYNKYADSNRFILKSPFSQYCVYGRMSPFDEYYMGSDPDKRTYDYGVKLSGNSGDFNYELFSLSHDEGPTTLNRYGGYSGATVGIATERVRLGVTAARCAENFMNEEDDPGLSRGVQNILGIHGEYDFSDCLSMFFMASSTDYSQDGALAGDRYSGSAFMGGLVLSTRDGRSSIRASWQHVGADYDPLDYHKASIYHNNYEGVSLKASRCWGSEEDMRKGRNVMSLSYYDLSQIKRDAGAASSVDGRLQGDYFFNGAGTGATGRITMLTPSVNAYFEKTGISVGAEYEKMRLWRPQDSAGSVFSKSVDNWSIWSSWEMNDHWRLKGGYREVSMGGEWTLDGKLLPFLQKASIPKLEITYRNREHSKVTLHAEFQDFKDMTPGTNGSLNDWHGTLVYVDTSLRF